MSDDNTDSLSLFCPKLTQLTQSDLVYIYVCVCVCGFRMGRSFLEPIYPTPPLGQDITQGQFFKRGLAGLNSVFLLLD